MSLYIDIKYAKIAAVRLERHVLKSDSPLRINGRCKVCGDSRTNKSKMRFHMNTLGDIVMCTCFNCGLALPIGAYLKNHEPDLFSEYKFETYRTGVTDSAPVVTTKIEEKPAKRVSSLSLPLVSELPENAACAVYVRSRGIPDYPLYYAEDFNKFCEEFTDIEMGKSVPRLVIPFFDKKGRIYALQGRDLTGTSAVKYLTVPIDPKMPLMFGIDRVNVKERVHIVEGPIDSLFLPNSIAAVNSGLLSTARKLSPVVNKRTLIFDNEPRNREIVAMYEAALKEDESVVIWPTSPAKKEDINDMVLAGKDPMKVIEKRTFSGLMGLMELNKWKRI